jgi:hypothetical protein
LKEIIKDRYGNEIYITNERWEHIFEYHPDMTSCQQHILKTIRTGSRKQHHLQLDTFIYKKRFDDLESGMTHIFVIVKFGFKRKMEKSVPNNFVLTAYPKRILK